MTKVFYRGRGVAFDGDYGCCRRTRAASTYTSLDLNPLERPRLCHLHHLHRLHHLLRHRTTRDTNDHDQAHAMFLAFADVFCMDLLRWIPRAPASPSGSQRRDEKGVSSFREIVYSRMI